MAKSKFKDTIDNLTKLNQDFLGKDIDDTMIDQLYTGYPPLQYHGKRDVDIDLMAVINEVVHQTKDTAYNSYMIPPHKTLPPRWSPFDPNVVYNVLLEIFSNKSLLVEFLSNERVLEYLVELHATYKKQRDRASFRRTDSNFNDLPSSEISTEDYEEAVDLVDSYKEKGLNTLTESEKEIFQECIELIEKYENS